MSHSEIDPSLAVQVIESLRQGIPPQRGVDLYSVGYEKLIKGIEQRHLSSIGARGKIRFVKGSWGAGKTHFFRLLREVAFQNKCLVSNVELNVNEAALNRFERVFYSIVSNVASPNFSSEEHAPQIAPFGQVIQESLAFLSTSSHSTTSDVLYENFTKASDALFSEHGIDIDFKKMIQHYWKTYLPDGGEPGTLEQRRSEILQWFGGEGAIGVYRKKFGVNKMISMTNAKLMLQSLAAFVRLSGYRGLVILFDEAEQAYSIMRQSTLRDAHNNLLSLINDIERVPGLFLVYATTPDFFNHPKHGIIIYPPLAGRIGQPVDTQPRALDTIWNLDAEKTELADYQEAATKIRAIYERAYPDGEDILADDSAIEKFVAELYREHPAHAGVPFWRVMVTALVTHLDDYLEGEVRPVSQLYPSVMDRLARFEQ